MNSKFIVTFVILIVIVSLYSFGETKVILTILGLSTIVFILEAVGFLPLAISRFINKNRLGATIEVLNELGFDVKEKRKAIKDCEIQNASNINIEKKLENITINKEVEIGKRLNDYYYPKYIDLMGATACEKSATDFARYLCKCQNDLNFDFDFIVTSKLGSPILGYEFAKLLEIPFVLHSEEIKFRLRDPNEEDPRMKFDFGCLNYTKARKALIVDDSTTGGRKVINIIKDLKKYGFDATDCLVVFAPQGKQADEKLAKENVKLHSIVQTPIKN